MVDVGASPALTGWSIARVFKRTAEGAGLVTEAARAGRSLPATMDQTHHRSVALVQATSDGRASSTTTRQMVCYDKKQAIYS